MHSLLLGNGINRLSKQLDWLAILKALADSVPNADEIRHFERKPLSLFFEELCSAASISTPSRQAEIEIKRKISSLLKEASPEPLLKEFTDVFSVILTTNYDHAIESTIAGPLYRAACLMQESRYSLFRRTLASSKVIWHIHGDIYYPETILLGYDHYAGYLQKIRNYQVGGLTQDQIKSLIKHTPAISRNEITSVHLFSWVDHFLRDHLHIVGLGLDFTEIDLWWLLVYKRRRTKKTGLTFYYAIKIPGETDIEDEPHLSLLRSLDVQLHVVYSNNYREGYEKILGLLKENMSAYPKLLKGRAQTANSGKLDEIKLTDLVSREKSRQLALRLFRRK